MRALYERAIAEVGPALRRIAHAYEAHPEHRQDVLQEIHVALWQSLSRFDGRCALGTWVYRVAHNTATSFCIRRRRHLPVLVSIEELELPADPVDRERSVDDQRAFERILACIQRLTPLDRQVMLLYLEDLDAAGIGEIVGLSAVNVATKVHRIKKVLARQVLEKGR